jgi:hypothetical protein
MIGLSLLSSVSKHTMWLYYDWVYCCCRPSVNTILCLLTDYNNDNPIIIRPHIAFTDEDNDNRLSVNIQFGRIMIGFIVVVVRQ